MAQNGADFKRTTQRDKAAMLLASDVDSDETIARRVGIGRRTLVRWKDDPRFRTWIAEHRSAQQAAVKAEGIASKQNRIAALNDRWHRMQQVIEARAEEHKEIPGGATGLILKQLKSIGFGENNTVVEEYAVDVPLLRELRAHEEQAAKELGQWTESKDVSGDITLRVVYDRIADA